MDSLSTHEGVLAKDPRPLPAREVEISVTDELEVRLARIETKLLILEERLRFFESWFLM